MAASKGDACLSAEDKARIEIDRKLEDSGWAVQAPNQVNLGVGRGVAVREFNLRRAGLPSQSVVWPSTTPDHWWVEIHAKPVGGLIPSVEVTAALALADFHAEKWSIWEGRPEA
jgi:hypothetical protein